MKYLLILILTLFIIPPGAVWAQDQRMRIELAEKRVDITTGFNGAAIVVFGTVNGGGDVVMTLKGPEHKTIIRKRERVVGAWINRAGIEFRRVPSYYDYVSTMDETALETYPELREQGQIGINYLDFYSEDETEDSVEAGHFRDALIRQMQEKGFYPIKPGIVQMLSPGFFKAAFDLPPGVPTGLYTVEAMLIDGGDIAARELLTLQVGQVGFNARIYLFAENHSFLYGVSAVLLALFSGWAAYTFLRRD